MSSVSDPQPAADPPGVVANGPTNGNGQPSAPSSDKAHCDTGQRETSPQSKQRESKQGMVITSHRGVSTQLDASPRPDAVASDARYRCEPPSREVMLEDFNKIDVDRSGEIDRDELMVFLRDLPGITDDDAAHVFDRIDADSSGAIDFDEFCEWVSRMYETLGDHHEALQCDACDGDASEHASKSAAGRSPPQWRMATALKTFIAVMKDKMDVSSSAKHMTDKRRVAKQRIETVVYSMPSISPDRPWRRWWDVIVLLAVTYHWIVCTTQVALVITPGYGAYVGWEYFVSLLYCIDVLLICRTAIQLEDGSFSVIAEIKSIIRYQMRTGYIFTDILSAIPFDLTVWIFTGSVTSWRTLRCLRFFKLIRVRKLFPMTDRGSRYMTPSFANFYFWIVPMSWIGVIFVGAVHAVTLGRIIVSPDGYHCTGEELGLADYGQDRCYHGIFEQYGLAFFWMWAIMTTQGMATLENGVVYVYAGFVMTLSLLLQGLIVANMSAIMLKSNINAQNLDNMRSTLAVLNHYALPKALQQEVLSFQYHSLQQNASLYFSSIMKGLPVPMQNEVGLYVKLELVTKVPMFQDVGTDCLIELANCLEQHYTEPEGYLMRFGDVGEEMFFLLHGFADVIIHTPDGDIVVATVKRGDFFGEVALISKSKRTATIQALTYCDLFRLGSDEFEALVTRFDILRTRMDEEATRRGIKNKIDKDASIKMTPNLEMTTPDLDGSRGGRSGHSSAEPTPVFDIAPQLVGTGALRIARPSHAFSAASYAADAPDEASPRRASRASHLLPVPAGGMFTPTHRDERKKAAAFSPRRPNQRRSFKPMSVCAGSRGVGSPRPGRGTSPPDQQQLRLDRLEQRVDAVTATVLKCAEAHNARLDTVQQQLQQLLSFAGAAPSPRPPPPPGRGPADQRAPAPGAAGAAPAGAPQPAAAALAGSTSMNKEQTS